MSALNRVTAPSRQTVRDRADQVKNNAGGYVFKVDDENRLRRFLVLGTDGGTYYVDEKTLTWQNIDFVDDLIKRDPVLVYNVTASVSDSGAAYRNTAAIYVAARMLIVADQEHKGIAKDLVSKVCRSSTHVFQLCSFLDRMGGWGQAKMGAVRRWYESRNAAQLAYQAVKYRGGRYDWTHRDVLRTVHPKNIDQRVGNFMLHGNVPIDGSSDILSGFAAVQSAKTIQQVISTLETFKNLPWEAIPTEFLRDPDVWKTLFFNGQLNGQNLLRNLKRLHEVGAFDDILFASRVGATLSDREVISKGRIHPMQYLFAMKAANVLSDSGSGYYLSYYDRTASPGKKLTGPVADGLDAGFYASFASAPRINGAVMIGVDVSGSMASPIMSSRVDYRRVQNQISCAQGAGAMAMLVARTAPAYYIHGFAGNFRDLGISASDKLPAVMRKVHDNNFGTTDCSLPMMHALHNRIKVDTFVVITDNETYAGMVKPSEALKRYRSKINSKAKLVVIGMTATPFTIADPDDSGMLDVVGFDANAPVVISEFANR